MRYISVLLLLISTLTGKVIEFHSFQDLHSHLTPDTLVVLDVDDTLLITKQMLGCDEWFLHRLKRRKLDGVPHNQALEKTLAEWEAIRHLTQMEIVEPNSEAVIQSLQRQGYCVMGLTTQGLALATRTIHQLGEKGINLSMTAPAAEDVYFTLNQHGVLFRQGVLFTSGTPKGKALLQLCEKIGFQAKRIVFVNDKGTHIAEIEGPASQSGIEFLGLRFTYSDARKKAFIPEVAELQFNQSNFSEILSDEQAKAILRKRLD